MQPIFPPDGVETEYQQPTIVAGFANLKTPVDLETVRMYLDGVDVTSDARVNVDGQYVADLEPGDEVTVVRGSHTARFIRFAPRNFVRSVRDKFHLHDG